MSHDTGCNTRSSMNSSDLQVRVGDPSPATLRYIRAAGHACLVGILIIFVLLFTYHGAPYDQAWHLVLAQLLSGRAGSTGLGLQKGFNPYYLFFQISMQDFILMLYVYPWFVTGYQHLSRFPVIGPALSGVHELALRHKSRIAPYGAIGLILFVLFPFWSTGPLVGVVVGYLIGLRTWATFASVIAGNLSAVAAWILFYDRLNSYSPKAALTFLVVVFVLAAIGTFFARFRRAQRHRARAAMSATPNAEEPKRVSAPTASDEAMVPVASVAAPTSQKEAFAPVQESPAPPSDIAGQAAKLLDSKVDSAENRAAG